MTDEKSRRYQREWYRKNRERRIKAATEWRKQNPTRARDTILRRKYGISVAQYEELFVEQNGACAICEQPCPTGNRLAVDHDHSTDEVRGLLCNRCNRAIGMFQDSPQLLRRAASYINRKDQRTRK